MTLARPLLLLSMTPPSTPQVGANAMMHNRRLLCVRLTTSFNINNGPLCISQATLTNSHPSTSPGTTCATRPHPASQDPLTRTPILGMALQSARTRGLTLGRLSLTLTLHTMTEVATGTTMARRLPRRRTRHRGKDWSG